MPHALIQKYRQQLLQLDHTRKRMELLYGKGQLALRDIHAVYESLFLRAVVGFELYCDTLFHQILVRDICYSKSRVACRITTGSKRAIRDIVSRNGKDQYITWLPYDRAEATAEIYLKDGRPFTDVDSSQKGMLTKIVAIRHAIAHSSDKSRLDFQSKVISSLPLLMRERTPAAFLRSAHSGTPPLTRFETYVASLRDIAVTIMGTPIAAK